MQSVHEALSLEDLRTRRARRLERTRSERPFTPLVAENVILLYDHARRRAIQKILERQQAISPRRRLAEGF
jgi:hypothetical protein